MTAEERGMELMRTKGKDLPPLAWKFAHALAKQIGGCMEVFLSAYTSYAEMVEGLEVKDDLYKAPSDVRGMFQKLIDEEKGENMPNSQSR